MSESDNGRDKIYVARVNSLFGKRYALYHCQDESGKLMPRDVIDYGVTADRIAGYLDGLTVNNSANVDVINGIPDEVRGGWFPKVKLRHLSRAEQGQIFLDHSRFGGRLA
jgi:hypothetical protein